MAYTIGWNGKILIRLYHGDSCFYIHQQGRRALAIRRGFIGIQPTPQRKVSSLIIDGENAISGWLWLFVVNTLNKSSTSRSAPLDNSTFKPGSWKNKKKLENLHPMWVIRSWYRWQFGDDSLYNLRHNHAFLWHCTYDRLMIENSKRQMWNGKSWKTTQHLTISYRLICFTHRSVLVAFSSYSESTWGMKSN